MYGKVIQNIPKNYPRLVWSIQKTLMKIRFFILEELLINFSLVAVAVAVAVEAATAGTVCVTVYSSSTS